MKTVFSLVGARPQFIKEAMLGKAVRESAAWNHVVIHSGQHYDANLSGVFFEELGMPEPAFHLNVGSGSHATMTAALLTGIEGVLLSEKPDALLVYGDTNTTLAGALAAAKLHIPVVHVEAGIRMLPKTMPEEINRVLTDRISSVLCCCSALGKHQLAIEGHVSGVYVTGDIMYDVFMHMRHRFEAEKACATLKVQPGAYVVATLHRDYNVDDVERLRSILAGLERLSKESGLVVLFCVHPRTQKRINEAALQIGAGVRLLPPLGYIELMSLVEAAALVVTDSGGLQKEAYYAGKRAVVVMPDVGWRELVDGGWNLRADPTEKSVAQAAEKALAPAMLPEDVYGDGRAAEQIIRAVLAEMDGGTSVNFWP